jgi:Rrf2 family protein
MKLTSQEEYGLRCLLQIARQPEEFSTIQEIASQEGLTPTYVAKLLRVMRKAGLVTSIRGRKGGFRLGRSADQIQVGTVLGALGGWLYWEDFCKSHRGHKRICAHDMDCSIRSLWIAIDALVQAALSRMKLKDLLRSERQMRTWCRSNLKEVPVGKAVSLSMQCPGASRPVL